MCTAAGSSYRVARAKEQNTINITIFIYMRKDIKFVQIRRAKKWHGVKFQTDTTCTSIPYADGVDIYEPHKIAT